MLAKEGNNATNFYTLHFGNHVIFPPVNVYYEA